ncbi:hypothetical protein Pan241w_18340 [Gimesia alba]|uniref:Uncharacterized protein n=1 Tax=Gimesia alba TaxID=2527973 RepID=A0A517RD09_9PLAN|nr:hypothetical protein Pan241w_18340 [Gimesia alba]
MSGNHSPAHHPFFDLKNSQTSLLKTPTISLRTLQTRGIVVHGLHRVDKSESNGLSVYRDS